MSRGAAFVPQRGVIYAEPVLTMPFGLPGFAGFPPDFGGSGGMMPEWGCLPFAAAALDTHAGF